MFAEVWQCCSLVFRVFCSAKTRKFGGLNWVTFREPMARTIPYEEDLPLLLQGHSMMVPCRAIWTRRPFWKKRLVCATESPPPPKKNIRRKEWNSSWCEWYMKRVHCSLPFRGCRPMDSFNTHWESRRNKLNLETLGPCQALSSIECRDFFGRPEACHAVKCEPFDRSVILLLGERVRVYWNLVYLEAYEWIKSRLM